jgi:hypothetical protein
MDYLRSCYTSRIWTFNTFTGVYTPVAIKWFKAPIGAQVLPVRHQYRSNIWSKGIPYPEKIGEIIEKPSGWSNGAPVAGYNGINYCGTQWTGVLNRLTHAIPSHPNGSPACCAVLPTCGSCVLSGSNCKTTYTVVLAGGTGVYAIGNGTYHTTLTSPCTWTAVGGGGIQVQLFFSGSTPEVVWNPPAFPTASYNTPVDQNCLGPLGPWNLTFASDPGAFTSVSVS